MRHYDDKLFRVSWATMRRAKGRFTSVSQPRTAISSPDEVLTDVCWTSASDSPQSAAFFGMRISAANHRRLSKLNVYKSLWKVLDKSSPPYT